VVVNQKPEGGRSHSSAAKTLTTMHHALSAMVIAVAAAVSGCAATTSGLTGDPTVEAKRLAGGPAAAPAPSRTSFSDALSCMDEVMLGHGKDPITLVVEDLPDKTGKVAAGSRDMFASAMSQMTKTSRAIRLRVPQRDDRGNVTDDTIFIVGGVTQFDDAIVRRQQDGAWCIGQLCIGKAESDSLSAMGVDLNALRGRNRELLSGVTSNNAVLIVRKGTGADGELNLRRFGINYNLTVTNSEGTGQALRTLVEFGSIQFAGRLMRVPYWRCLGADDKNPEVAIELRGWWYALSNNVDEHREWWQRQMVVRGLLKKETEHLLPYALEAYVKALGQPTDGVGEETFKAYLLADHAVVQPQAMRNFQAKLATLDAAERAPMNNSSPPATVSAQAPVATSLIVSDRRGRRASYERGEQYEVEVSVPRAGHLYCFVLDAMRKTHQVFPYLTPTPRTSAVSPGKVLLPGGQPYRLVASRVGGVESFVCAHSERDLGTDPLLRERASPASAGVLVERLRQLGGPSTLMGEFDVTSK
jgi:hypothetical protein